MIVPSCLLTWQIVKLIVIITTFVVLMCVKTFNDLEQQTLSCSFSCIGHALGFRSMTIAYHCNVGSFIGCYLQSLEK